MNTKDAFKICYYALDTRKVRAHDGQVERAENCTHKVQNKEPEDERK